MSETYVFIAITGLLLTLGFIMPYVNSFVGDATSTTNDIEGLGGVRDNDFSYITFAGSMLNSFFWYYGELPVFANVIKVGINLVWAYLLARLLRGGG